MKKIAFFLLMTLVSFACSKTAEQPDLADAVAGDYGVTTISVDNQTTSLANGNVGISMRLTLSKTGTNKVNMQSLVHIQGSGYQSDFTEVTLIDAGSGRVNMIDNGKTIGTIKINEEIELDGMSDQGQRIIAKGIKLK